MQNGQETQESRSRALGYALAVVQAVFYATLGIFGKLLYATGLDSHEVVILRFLCTTVLLGAFMLVWRKEPLASRERAVYVQAVFFFLSAFLYFFAVERMSAGMTTVIFYTFPLFVALMNAVFFRERLSASTAVALALALVGLVFVSGIAAGMLVLDVLGIAFGIGSSLTFAIYTVLIQKTGRTEGPLTVTFTLSWTSLAASCAVFAPSVPTMLHLSAQQVALGCTMSLLSTIVPIIVFIEAVKRIGATKSSLISISETPASLLLAFVLLGETFTAMQGLGALLVVGSVVIVTAAPLVQAKRT